MRLSTLLMAVIVIAGLPAAGWAASALERVNDSTPTPLFRDEAEERQHNSTGENTNEIGAQWQEAKAESVRRAEADYQAQLTGLARAVTELEKRVAEFRKQANPPASMDIDRLEHDLALAEQELNKVTLASPSPLVELQRAELQDRLFELQVSVEIIKRRWGGMWKVFGMDFFTSVPPTKPAEFAPIPRNYKIRMGDQLRIMVSSELGAQDETHPTVDSSGRVFVSGAGSVMASGKTAEQLQAYLTNRVRSKFKQLSVAVAVEKLQTIRVQVTGEVAKPGTYSLTGTATVFDALYQAGGPTKSGSFRKISLVRDGEPKRPVDLYDLLVEGNKKGDYPLDDGDLIFVPPVGGTIVVDGEVVRAGRYEPAFPISLEQALKLAGGVRPGAYLQMVQVERVENGEYRRLMNEPISSAAASRVALKPGDQISVSAVRPDRTNQVEINGPVGAPGIYGLSSGMRVNDLIKLAQGLAQNKELYTGRADILRTDPLKGTEIVTLELDKAMKGDESQNLALQKLDRLFLYEPEQVVYRPRLVTVLGAVAKPGPYKRTDGMCVRDIVAAAGGLLPDAYLARAEVIRRADDGTKELVRVDLKAALTGDPGANIRLCDRDAVTIYLQDEVAWSERRVRVEGAVQRPGVYARMVNMRVSDLLFAAGGVLPEASEVIEVAHSEGKGESRILRVDLGTMVSGSEQDIPLSDRDVLTVPAVNPSTRMPEVVYITGEVANPGPYTLNNRDEKLVDLIKRAGGLTRHADVRGLLFLRQKESFENTQQGQDADIILNKSRAFADKQFLTHLAKLGVGLPGQFIQAVQESSQKLAKPAEVVSEMKLKTMTEEADTVAVTQGPKAQPTAKDKEAQPAEEETEGTSAKKAEELMVAKSESLEKAGNISAMGPRVPEIEPVTMSGFEGRQELAKLLQSSRISLDLNRAFQDPSSPDNMPLRQADRIYVPKITNVVTVIGAVLHPHPFAAGPGKSVDYYIERSGGFAQDASKANVVVIRSNGDALPKGKVRTVEPGDMIVVSNTGLIDIAKKWERIAPVTKILCDVLSSAYVLTRF